MPELESVKHVEIGESSGAGGGGAFLCSQCLIPCAF